MAVRDGMAMGLREGAVDALAGAMRARSWAVATAASLVAWVVPSSAFATDATDPDWYKSFTHGQGVRASDAVRDATGVSEGSPSASPFPNVGTALAQIAGIIVALVPAVFVIKFAGRALLSVIYANSESTHSESIDMPMFFRTAEERGKNAVIRPGSAWYITMAKEFLLYFGIAVGAYGIISLIFFLIGFFIEGAPVTGEGYLNHFTG